MKWSILEKKLLLTKLIKFWHIKLKYQKFGGEMSNICDWVYIEKKDTVAILLFDPALNKLVFVKQFRLTAEFHKDDNSMLWPLEIVAGHVDDGENIKAAALREVKEEVGVTSSDISLATKFYSSPGMYGERVHLFIAKIDSRQISLTPQGLKAENEDVMPVIMPLEEAYSLVANGKISDAKTIIAVLWLKANL
ncbi:MAG: NUDIX hydrolase [SAR324 cluster bacterium]|nr:NUDIX hydrolase [SAR324 cluster bacterium]